MPRSAGSTRARCSPRRDGRTCTEPDSQGLRTRFASFSGAGSGFETHETGSADTESGSVPGPEPGSQGLPPAPGPEPDSRGLRTRFASLSGAGSGFETHEPGSADTESGSAPGPEPGSRGLPPAPRPEPDSRGLRTRFASFSGAGSGFETHETGSADTESGSARGPEPGSKSEPGS